MTPSRRQFVMHTVAVTAAWATTAMGMTQLQRMIVLAPPQLNATGQSIVAALNRQGTPANAELVRWIADAVTVTDSRKFQVTATTVDSQSIAFTVQGQGQLRTWWGDGATAQLVLTDTPQNIGHAYATAARRGVVMIGAFTIS